MSTRATIKFSNRDETYFVYRHCDGFPDIILEDIKDTIELSENRWSEPQLGLLVTLFLAKGYEFKEERLPNYEITNCFHGDESYKYFIEWDSDKKQWDYGVF
jgi:hypothetical protein